jgi:2-C-methyl-D-erythritol 2,4-cyclodiphosphate synthase/2-C-methyl-D-erythritol 4-phosphate cytidylyltransferase
MDKPFVSVIIAAAGMSRRMSSTSSKQFIKINSVPIIEYSIRAFSNSEYVSEIIIVTKIEDIPETEKICSGYPKVKCVVLGGAERFDSVRNAFAKVSEGISLVAIHDAARPLITTDFINNLIENALKNGAVCPVGRIVDTIKQSTNSDTVDKTVDRSKLYAAQTPQIFKKELYSEALKKTENADVRFTDDTSIVEYCDYPVHIVINDNPNIKITRETDIALIKHYLSEEVDMKIGHGYDVHRLTENRELIIGGVNIPYSLGLLGHSDADVLVHAIMDALIGAMGLGDIGKHFPDSDEKYKGISSITLLEEVNELLMQGGYTVGNIDATVIAQKPKLAEYIPHMRVNIATALDCPVEAVNIKATTEEGLGFTGDLSGISAHAVAIIKK